MQLTHEFASLLQLNMYAQLKIFITEIYHCVIQHLKLNWTNFILQRCNVFISSIKNNLANSNKKIRLGVGGK